MDRTPNFFAQVVANAKVLLKTAAPNRRVTTLIWGVLTIFVFVLATETRADNWALERSVDAFTDEEITTIYVTSPKIPNCSETKEVPRLQFQCGPDPWLSFFVSHGCYVPPDADGYVRMRIRFGDKAPTEFGFEPSVDDAGFGDHGAPMSMRWIIRNLSEVDRVRFELLPFRKPSEILEFQVPELELALEEVSWACSND